MAADALHGIDDGGDADLENEEHYDRHGVRITPEYAESAADALERGDIEIDEASIAYPRRRPGRPSLSEPAPGEASPKIQARVSVETQRRLNDLAEQQRRAASDIVREALEEYLSHH